MKTAPLPDGWDALTFGPAALYFDPSGTVRYVHCSEYYGGDNMESVYQVTDEPAAITEFSALGEREKALNVLDAEINGLPDDAGVGTGVRGP